jgi:hypothetical protein
MDWIDRLDLKHAEAVHRAVECVSLDAPTLTELTSLGRCMTLIFGTVEREGSERQKAELGQWFASFAGFCLHRFFREEEDEDE